MRGGQLISWCLHVVVLYSLCQFATGDERTQRYEIGEKVTLWANKVGPYENPQETYSYYTLPFCDGDAGKSSSRWPGLGEALEGNALVQTAYRISFAQNLPRTIVCSLVLDRQAEDVLSYAIRKHYWAKLELDELPVWAMLGQVHPSNSSGTEEEHLVYTHKRFMIGYNRDRLIHVNMTHELPVRITANVKLDLSYELVWYQTSIPFSHRFHRYLDQDFFEHPIHWFAIFNSVMMVLFLVGLVALIMLRTLKTDLHRYSRHLDEEDGGGEVDMHDDTGWKQVQSEVFRFPGYLPLLCGLVGTGVQLIIMVYLTTIFCLLGDLYVGRGAITATAVVVYALSSGAAGFVSARMYVQSRGNAWVKTMMVTGCAFSLACFAVCGVLNGIAIAWASLAAIPFGTIVIMVMIWLLVSSPLVLFGTVVGRNTAAPYVPPARVAQIPRQIPEKRWYLQPYVYIPVGGVLPFGSIFIEMYFIFSSLWNYKFYYVYGFVLLVFTILLLVNACVSVVMTYFLLNAEDYRWPWAAFLSGAATGGYVLLYAVYYFFAKTQMYGALQTSFYFGQMLILSGGLGLVCGTMAYLGARLFVFRIFTGVKGD
mmetsp:Transcript_95568/g.154166  ORF Transcript_95568/g.154166 Transcript_95568/m.154166 type:complete len:594 (-) Transcript_95568:320-2101(-)